ATVSNQSREFSVASLPVSVAFSAEPARVLATLRQVASELAADPAFASFLLAPPDVPGIDRINGLDPVLRELRRRVLETFAREGIPLSSNTSTLILQQKVDPTAPPAQHP